MNDITQYHWANYQYTMMTRWMISHSTTECKESIDNCTRWMISHSTTECKESLDNLRTQSIIDIYYKWDKSIILGMHGHFVC